jgi:hypothetical protein
MMPGNPYSAYGTIASGSRFVGRDDQLGWLKRRLYEGRSSAALIGLTRVGKSSIARRVIAEPPDADTVTGWINVAAAKSGAEVLRHVLGHCPAAAATTRVFLSAGSANGSAEPTMFDLFGRVREGLLRLRRSGRYLVIALDEFDSVRHFADAHQFLTILRELVYHPDHMPMAVLTVARRPIDRIEVEAADISTFAGVCESSYLGPMSYAEIGAMAGRSAALPADAHDLAWMYAGGHPFLSEVIFARILEHGIADIERFIGPDLSDYYRKVEGFLRREGLWEALLRLAVGPAAHVDAEQSALIRRYGLIAEDGSVLSSDFAMFLQSRGDDAVRQPQDGPPG